MQQLCQFTKEAVILHRAFHLISVVSQAVYPARVGRRYAQGFHAHGSRTLAEVILRPCQERVEHLFVFGMGRG
jgi:hypothetical protein